MAKWSVTGSVVGSKYLGEVEASNAEDAEQVAWDTLDIVSSMCHQCSDECEDPEIENIFVSLLEDGDPD